MKLLPFYNGGGAAGRGMNIWGEKCVATALKNLRERRAQNGWCCVCVCIRGGKSRRLFLSKGRFKEEVLGGK